MRTGSLHRATAFSAAVDFNKQDIVDVQSRMRTRGLRFLEHHGHLDRAAVDSLDATEHAGGWSVDASVRIAEWDRQGLDQLVRDCARPPLSADRLEQLNESTLVYHLRKPTLDGHTEIILKPVELLEQLSKLITPPRIHKHRYCGVLVPNALQSGGSCSTCRWSGHHQSGQSTVPEHGRH